MYRRIVELRIYVKRYICQRSGMMSLLRSLWMNQVREKGNQ